jgi:hypothetical protein
MARKKNDTAASQTDTAPHHRFELLLEDNDGKKFRQMASKAGYVQGPQNRPNMSAYLHAIAQAVLKGKVNVPKKSA